MNCECRILRKQSNGCGNTPLPHDRWRCAGCVAVHPPERARFRAELIGIASLPGSSLFEGTNLRDSNTLDAIAGLHPELGVSVLYGYIFGPELLRLFPRGIVNLHPSLLPWNRGAFPNVWSLIDGTPSGVTLHWIDEGVDTGDVIAQREVMVEPVDTGATLYRKLEAAGISLFAETWASIRNGTAPRIPQQPGTGTYHRTTDVRTVDRIDLDEPTTARSLLNRLRARTFRPFESTWFETEDGRRVQLRVDLEYASEDVNADESLNGVHE